VKRHLRERYASDGHPPVRDARP